MASDDFAGLTAGTNLNTRSGWTQRSGTLEGSAAGGSVVGNSGGDSLYAYTGEARAADQWAECVYTKTGSSGNHCIGPAVRVTSGGAAWAAIVSNSEALTYINLYSGGGYAGTSFNYTAPSVGTVVRLSIESIGGSNSRLKLYYDGAQVWTQDVSVGPLSGDAGLGAYVGNTSVADDWASGDLSGGAGTTVSPGKGSVVFAGKTPSVGQPITVAPGKGSVVFAGKAPSVGGGGSGGLDTYPFTFDGDAKTVTMATGVVAFTAAQLWSRWADWVAHSDNSRYLPAMRHAGGDDLGGGLSIPNYIFLLNGWRVRPFEGDHTLVITGNLFVEGGGVPVMQTLGDYNVSVQYTVPVQAQGIATSGSTGPTAEAIAAAVWAYVSRTMTGVTPANVKQVNDVPIAGTGAPGTDPWRPA